jgi:hypothetical protein
MQRIEISLKDKKEINKEIKEKQGGRVLLFEKAHVYR